MGGQAAKGGGDKVHSGWLGRAVMGGEGRGREREGVGRWRVLGL